ncbi:MAG: cytoplasmic protein [Desulfobacteraceae bacterium]|jgi:hypothetical protein|nr:MAG: cytoplasmic protein [Desulfobacteraceae bacterium]
MNDQDHPNPAYTHDFVKTYQGLIAFGWDRETDEQSIICYLQMFADDTLMKTLAGRLTDSEINDIQNLIHRLLKAHLTEPEYHRLFLKEDHR